MVLSTRLKDERMAGRAEGRAAGREEGMIVAEAKERQSTAIEMLKDKESLTKIIKYSRLSEKEIYALAEAHGLEVME